MYTWLTQSYEQMPGVQINIKAQQEHPPEGRGLFFIGGDITIKNAGTKRTRLRLADGPLFVALVEEPDKAPTGTTAQDPKNFTAKECSDGKLSLEHNPHRFWLSRPKADGRADIELQDEIRPGEEDVFHFLVRVQKAGTYAVMFSSELPTGEETYAWPYEEDQGSCAQKQPSNRWTKFWTTLFFIPNRDNGPHPRWESAASFVNVEDSKPQPSNAQPQASKGSP